MYLNYTNERLQELISIIDDIRVYELSYGYYEDMTDIILILQTLVTAEDALQTLILLRDSIKEVNNGT